MLPYLTKIVNLNKKKSKEKVGFKVKNVCTVSFIKTLFAPRKVIAAFNVENRLGVQLRINVEIRFRFQR